MQHVIKIDAHPRLAEMLVLADEMDAAGYPVCIAGGAPRDLILGNEVKDFDFFVAVPFKVGSVEKSVLDLTVMLFIKYGKPSVGSYYEDSGPEGTIVTLKAEGIDVVLINREGLKNEQSIVDRFDTPLCQTWIIGKDHGDEVLIETTEAFKT